MNALHAWLAETMPGQSWLQQGGLGHGALCLTAPALRAGARRAFHVQGAAPDDAAWTALRDAAAPHADRLTTLVNDAHEGEALARAVPRVDVACVVQLFHERDPYRVLHNIARLARRHLVVASCVVPHAADGLLPGDQVAGSAPNDPRLDSVRRVFGRRGVEITQFHIPPHRIDAHGQHDWDGMWHWFQTREALEAMVESFGWRITARHAVWDDIGWVLVAQRV